MRLSYAKLALATVMSAVVVAPFASAMAQSKTSSEVRVDINLVDMDMLTATRTLFERTGVQFLVEPGIEEFKKVTLRLNNVTPEEAVRYICQAAGATFRKDEAGVFIISHFKPETVAPAAMVEATTAAKKPHVFKKIRVLKAGARETYDMIMYGIPFNSARGFEDLRKFMGTATGSDFVNRNYGPQFNILNSVPAAQMYGPAQAPTQSLPIASESGSQVLLPGEANKQRGGGGGGNFGGGGGGNLGGGGGQGNGGGGLGGGGQNGGTGATLVPGQGLVGSGIDFISYDPNDNSIIVRGDEEDITQLQSYINQFDVAPQQVEIKVEFVTTSDSFQQSLGYDFLYSRGAISAGTRPGLFAKSSDPIFVNYATGNIATRLRASLTVGDGRVVTAPIVRTLNNQPASINSTVNTWVFLNQTTVSNGTVINSSNPTQISISTFLVVAPRINADGTVTLNLSPQLTNITGSVTDPNGSELPVTTAQTVNLVARVKSGDTIVLGGLNAKNEKSNSNKIPVLSELPIIGQFFRSTAKSRDNSELLIFVTPRIIEDEQGAITP